MVVVTDFEDLGMVAVSSNLEGSEFPDLSDRGVVVSSESSPDFGGPEISELKESPVAAPGNKEDYQILLLSLCY